MAMSHPKHCRPSAYACLAEYLPQLETTPGLLGAACALAMHELGDISPVLIAARLDRYADVVRSRARSGTEAALLAHLHHLLFEEEGFTGNVGDYYHPGNSYLPVVLERRLGLPITLCLIYKAVAERLGLQVVGINAPGHFLAALTNGTHEPRYIDAFDAGRLLTAAEAVQQVSRVIGIALPADAGVLPVATHRQWITRMIHNLQRVFEATGRTGDLAAMRELLALLEQEPCSHG